MKNQVSTFTFLLLFSLSINAQVDSTEESQNSTFGITLTQENAFGFYPVVYGTIGLSPDLDLTFYGAMWTNPSFGFPQSTFSSDMWLENSFGLGFHAMNGSVYINPSIGFTHGKFLSGGDQSVAFEGIVPSLSLYMNQGSFESEIYVSLYSHLRDEVTDPVNRSTAGMLFYWFTPGFWISNRISLGMHYEALFLKFGEGSLDSSYQWLGPYIKLRTNGKYDFRFMAGPNLKKGIYADEFYKLTVNIPLE